MARVVGNLMVSKMKGQGRAEIIGSLFFIAPFPTPDRGCVERDVFGCYLDLLIGALLT